MLRLTRTRREREVDERLGPDHRRPAGRARDHHVRPRAVAHGRRLPPGRPHPARRRGRARCCRSSCCRSSRSGWWSPSTSTRCWPSGVMLLAASPGGTTANLFSHLFHGDVALNVTLTAINSVLAAFTIPLITDLAIALLRRRGRPRPAARQGRAGGRDRAGAGRDRHAGAPPLAGLRGPRGPSGAGVLDRGAGRSSRSARSSASGRIGGYVQQVGLVTGLFCLVSLSLGYARRAAAGSTSGSRSRARWRSASTTRRSR